MRKFVERLLQVSVTMGFSLCAATTPLLAQSANLVTIKTPRGANQGFILIKPDKPVAAVILFAGGNGGLRLKSATDMEWGKGNFLVRTRDMFAAQGLMVAVFDAPSDSREGMKATFRFSSEHAADIGAVAAHMKKEANVPVWTVGTSMGTWSAATGAMGARNIDGARPDIDRDAGESRMVHREVASQRRRELAAVACCGPSPRRASQKRRVRNNARLRHAQADERTVVGAKKPNSS